MSRISSSLRFGMTLTAVGAFFDAYSYMGRGGVFAGAQSGNVVLLGINIAHGDWHESIAILAPILSFMVGVAFAALLRQPQLERVIRFPERAILGCEIALIALVSFVPDTAHDLPMSMLVSFAAALQVATFRRLRDWSFTTTITTNNIVTAVTSTIHAVSTGDSAMRAQSIAFSGVVGAFLFGATIGGLATRGLGAFAGLLPAAVLVTLLVWLSIGEVATAGTDRR